MKIVLIVCFIFLGLRSNAQYNYSASDYTNGIDTLLKYTRFQFVGNMKSIDIKKIKFILLNMTEAEIRQMNIDSKYSCEVKQEDYFKLWNLYYVNLTRSSFNNYCWVCTFIMRIDGIISN